MQYLDVFFICGSIFFFFFVWKSGSAVSRIVSTENSVQYQNGFFRFDRPIQNWIRQPAENSTLVWKGRSSSPENIFYRLAMKAKNEGSDYGLLDINVENQIMGRPSTNYWLTISFAKKGQTISHSSWMTNAAGRLQQLIICRFPLPKKEQTISHSAWMRKTHWAAGHDAGSADRRNTLHQCWVIPNTKTWPNTEKIYAFEMNLNKHKKGHLRPYNRRRWLLTNFGNLQSL